MPKECCVTIIPLELYLTGEGAFEGHAFIPASQLHNPTLQNQSLMKNGTKSSFQHEVIHTVTSVAAERTELIRGVKRTYKSQTKEASQSEFQVNRDTRKRLTKGSCLPQQTKVFQQVADISKPEQSDSLKNLQVTKKNKTVSATYEKGENNAVINEKSSCTKQPETSITGKENVKTSKPEIRTIKHSRASRRKSNSEHDTRLSKNNSLGKAGTHNKGEGNCGNTEYVITAESNRQMETLVSKEFLEDMPQRSKRAKRQNYQTEDSNTSILEPTKKAKACRKVSANKAKKQGASTTKYRHINRYDEEKTQGKEKIPEHSGKQSARDILETKETWVQENIKSDKDEPKEVPVLREDVQGKSDAIEVRKVTRARAKPKRNQELTKDAINTSLNVPLRRSKRQCRVNNYYYDDSFEADEIFSFMYKGKKHSKQIKDNNLVTNEKAVNTNGGNSQKKPLKESTEQKCFEIDEKLRTMKALVCIEKTSQLENRHPIIENKENDKPRRGRPKNQSRNGSEEKQCKKENDKPHRGRPKTQSRSGGEENQCKEHETESTVKTNNTNKNTTEKSGQQTMKSKKPGRSESQVSQSAEDCKITAKKGTLKYLHQREKYITALAREAQGDDEDFSENPFFKKKKFKFTKLLPPSHEDTLVIKTPKRGINENQKNAVTPRTTMLGQLQPLTPTTQPYSPGPSLDSGTKKEALKQVYRFMKNKGNQPKRSRKVLHESSQQNIRFTPLELPAVPADQSGSDSDGLDEYFDD